MFTSSKRPESISAELSWALFSNGESRVAGRGCGSPFALKVVVIACVEGELEIGQTGATDEKEKETLDPEPP